MLAGQSFVNTCTSTRGWFANSYGSEAMGSWHGCALFNNTRSLRDSFIGSSTLEELWSFMGRDLAEVGGRVQTPLKMNESLPEGRGTL